MSTKTKVFCISRSQPKNWYSTQILLLATLLLSFLLANQSLHASGLVYTPVNPSFGGNPLNGNMLLNNAQAQNDISDPSLNEDLNALDDFNDRLQRALLTRLTRSVTSSIIDDLGNLIPGQTVTTDFIIDVVDEGDGTLSVTTTDRNSGDQTVFWVESGS